MGGVTVFRVFGDVRESAQQISVTPVDWDAIREPVMGHDAEVASL